MMKIGYDRFRSFIFGRREAYCAVLKYDNPAARVILRDLAEKCFAHETTMSQDAREQAANEALRGLWLHIQHQLKLTDEQLWELYGDGSEL